MVSHIRAWGSLAVVASTLVAVTACSSGSGGGTASTPPVSSVAAPTSAPADPNAHVCTDLRSPLFDSIIDTFTNWDPSTDEFDAKVSADLRDEATQMYGFAAKATGATADAISSEAKALTDVSIAMEAQDDSALATAATDANSALAGLRGTCNF
jgi:hypothetical protein